VEHCGEGERCLLHLSRHHLDDVLALDGLTFGGAFGLYGEIECVLEPRLGEPFDGLLLHPHPFAGVKLGVAELLFRDGGALLVRRVRLRLEHKNRFAAGHAAGTLVASQQ
jgi:hypothetical protein